ncbi:hypothetical protein F7018_14835 [Tenacibaculum aiptasiae]|uniref:Uncharacterized protein n=1 Tax=Tenacibaculum aiptasiae TaxID=426481 RepID=A0A7J5A9Q4_9FLAO|nr:hypothetical protein [Tenacibaculum aiptasiae]KAB1154245.1 hypothetical protein F7018_14835 [Tenacibaculum aiptasiae]
MNVNKIEDFKELKGDIEVNTLEELIFQLLNLFSINKTSWLIGIELLNDLISLKRQDGSVLSNKIGKPILNWIDSKYDNNVFKDFSGSYSSDDEESKQIVFIMDLTLDTIFKINHNTDVLPFLKSKLKKSSSEYESSEINNIIDWIKETKANPESKISDDILDQVLFRADKYFEEEYNSKNFDYLFCGLRETIQEYKLCYSIHWCLKSEKYLSNVKRTGWIGAGSLMIAKKSDKFERMGSNPFVDWVYLFELDIQNLEEYFHLEIPYKKEYLSKLKSVIKCSSQELLKMVNNEEKIIYTEKKAWCDHFPEFQNIADELNQVGIECQVEIKTRKKTTNNV